MTTLSQFTTQVRILQESNKRLALALALEKKENGQLRKRMSILESRIQSQEGAMISKPVEIIVDAVNTD